MARPCDFCGKTVYDMNVFPRVFNQGKSKADICGECAFMLAGLINTSDPKKTESAVKWGKEVVSNGKYNPDIYVDFCSQLSFAENGHNSVQSDNSVIADNPLNINPVNYSKQVNNNQTNNDSVYSYARSYVSSVSTFSIWMLVLKISAFVILLAMSIGGGAAGAMMFDGFGAVIGFLLGLIVGLVSVSAIMVFVEMAEDARATRQYVMQIRNMMEKDNNK